MAVITMTQEELNRRRGVNQSPSPHKMMTQKELEEYREKSKNTKLPLSFEGKELGEVSQNAYNAISSNRLDAYRPIDENEKVVIDKYKEYIDNQVHELKLNDGTNFGQLSYGGMKAISDGKLDDYIPKNDVEKSTINAYKKFVEKQPKEPKNWWEGTLHTLGYWGEKALSGAVDGVEDALDYAFSGVNSAAGFVSSGFNKFPNSISDGFYDNAKFFLNKSDADDFWDKSIESRYAVPGWARWGGDVFKSVGNMAVPMALEYASVGASPMAELQLANMAAKASTVKSTSQMAVQGVKNFFTPSSLAFGLGAAGSAASYGYKQTEDLGKSMLYGAYSGIGEMATERLFGGLAGTGIGESVIKFTAKNPIIRKALSFAGEGLEEIIMTAADTYFRRATIDKNAPMPTLKEYGESGLKGILMSGLMGLATYPVQRHSERGNAKALNAALDTLKVLMPDKNMPAPLNVDKARMDEIQSRQKEIQALTLEYHDMIEKSYAEVNTIQNKLKDDLDNYSKTKITDEMIQNEKDENKQKVLLTAKSIQDDYVNDIKIQIDELEQLKSSKNVLKIEQKYNVPAFTNPNDFAPTHIDRATNNLVRIEKSTGDNFDVVDFNGVAISKSANQVNLRYEKIPEGGRKEYEVAQNEDTNMSQNSISTEMQETTQNTAQNIVEGENERLLNAPPIERFTNENSSQSELEDKLILQNNVADEMRNNILGGVARLEQVAKAAKIDIKPLVNTVNNFNAKVNGELQEKFNKVEVSQYGDGYILITELLSSPDALITKRFVHGFANIWTNLWEQSNSVSYNSVVKYLQDNNMDSSREHITHLLTEYSIDINSRDEILNKTMLKRMAGEFRSWLSDVVSGVAKIKGSIFKGADAGFQNQAAAFSSGDWSVVVEDTPNGNSQNDIELELREDGQQDIPSSSDDMARIIQEYNKYTDEGLVDFAKNTLNEANDRIVNRLNYEISEVGSREAKDIKEIFGIDVSNFTHNIKGNTVIHINSGHGPNGTSDHSMSDINSIGKIGYIINNYDTIERLFDKNGKPVKSKEFKNSDNTPSDMILYKKRINGTYYLVEATPNTKANSLQIVSAYISKNKKGAKQALNMQSPQPTSETSLAQRQVLNMQSPQLTPKALPADTPSETNIPQGSNNVNADFPAPKDVYRVKTSEIKVSPEEYQFKSNVDTSGTTQVLKNVSNWDSNKAGIILVHRRNNGDLYVVNGHHRLELAKRLNVPYVDVKIVNEDDGVTVSQAKIMGAMLNIAEGRGTPIDVAKVFRDNNTTKEALKKEGISLSEGIVDKGYGISKLSNDLFLSVVNGMLTENHGAIIGNGLEDDTVKQELVYSLLKKREAAGKYNSDGFVRQAINMVKQSAIGQKETEQIGLFGETQTVTSAETKLELTAKVLDELKRIKNTFKPLTKTSKSDTIKSAGNKLSDKNNQAVYEFAEKSIELIDRQVYYVGTEISDLFNSYAGKVFSGDMDIKAAVNSVIEDLKEKNIGNTNKDNKNKSKEELNLNEQIDRWQTGKMQPSEYFRFGDTPTVLQKLGAKDLPLVMTQKVMEKITGGKHDVSTEAVKALPKAMEEPVMIFKSATTPNAFVILTELQDRQGRDIVAAIHLNKTEKHIKINRIASVYGRNNVSSFVETQIKDGNLKYIDKNKSQQWSQSRGLQLPKLADTTSDSNNNILQRDDIVNSNIKNDKNNRGNNTRSDLSQPSEDRWKVDNTNSAKKIKSIPDIVKYISDTFKIPISSGNMPQSNARGTYKKLQKTIRTRITNNLPTISHEIGHYLDDKYKLTQSPHIQEAIDAADPEFLKLYEKELAKSESVAEFVRVYLQTKAVAKEKAPNFYDDFVAALTKDGKIKQLDEAAKYINAYMTADIGERVDAAIVTDAESKKRPLKERLDETRRQAYEEIVDSFSPIKDAAEYVKEIKGDSISGSKNAYVLATNSRNADVIANHIITVGMTDMNGQINIGNSLIDCVKGVKPKELGILDRYLVLKHSLEWLEPKNGKVKRVFADEILQNTDVIRKEIEKIEEEKPEIITAAENLYEFQADVINYFLVEGGGMSAEFAEYLMELYPYYVPLYRAIKNPTGKVKGTFANQRSPIKYAKGSGAAILSPLESIITNTHRIVKFALRNRTMQVLTDNADTVEGFGQFMEKVEPTMKPHTLSVKGYKDMIAKKLKDSLSEDDFHMVTDMFDEILGDSITGYSAIADPKKRIVTVLKNGVPDYYQVHNTDLYEAIAEFAPKQLALWLRTSRTILTFMKTLITSLNPLFASTNPIRDAESAYKNSDLINNPVKFAVAYFKALKDIIFESDDYKRYLASGGGHSSELSANRNRLKRSLRAVANKDKGKAARLFSAMCHPLDLITDINDKAESIPRFLEYKETLDKTGDIQQAIYNAGDITTNFNRTGKTGRSLNSAFLFSNAAVQGIDKFVRSFKDATPKQRFNRILKYLIGAILKVAALAWWNRENDDEGYENLSSYMKNNYYAVSTGDGRFLKIPKARELSIFDSLVERSVDYAFGDKEAFYMFGGYIATHMVPPFIPTDYENIQSMIHSTFGNTALGPFVDIGFNKDFRGIPIVSEYMKDLPKQLQYDEKTTKPALWLGKLLNQSPMEIDHAISGYAGIIGQLNKALLPIEDEQMDVTMGAKNKFIADSNYSTDILNKVYEYRDKLNKKYKLSSTSQNAMAYEKYAVLADYITNINNAIRNLPEEAKRKARGELLQQVKEWDSKFNDNDREIIDLIEDENITSKYYLDGLPSNKLEYTKDKKKYVYEMTPEEYTQFIDDLLVEINKKRSTIIKTSKSKQVSSEKRAIDFETAKGNAISSIKDKYKDKLKMKFVPASTELKK